MSESKPLPAFEDRAPRDRFCDLILTGGVTSAIAYPAAVFALASAYRFNSIGGSSSGAGTAALAAAAEYRRRHGSSEGFRLLLERTAAVAEVVDGKTRLAWLFQPGRHTARLFKALVPGFARPTGKARSLLAGLARAYCPVALVTGLVFAAAVWLLGVRLWGTQWGEGALAGALSMSTLLIAGVIAAGLLLYRDIAVVVNDDYGLCSGMPGSRAALHPPLTQWLHELIQEIAGRHPGDPPLTFADLAAAPGSPKDTLRDPSPAGAVSINLQMYTANVTHGRPYVFPQPESTDDEDDDPPLYFRPSELRRLFPGKVVDFMKTDPVTGRSNKYAGNDAPLNPLRPGRWMRHVIATKDKVRPTAAPSADDEDALWRLPRRHLPIVVAARMSVSFPVLFRAVPMWVPDARDKARPPVLRRCLFSDGSLCSNFPIHLFDSLLPPWPTFGISLYDLPRWADEWSGTRAAAGQPPEQVCGLVTLPGDHRKGKDLRWFEFDYEKSTAGRLTGFTNALISTALNWNDATLARLPGVRDRVVQVGLNGGIGGLNILMKKKEIECLAELGAEAALLLLKRFGRRARRETGEVDDGWAEHRWVRFNIVCDSLASSLAGLSWSAAHDRYATPIRDAILRAVDEPPCAGDTGVQLTPADAAALDGALAALMAAERALTGTRTAEQPYRPSPRPVMRVRPPL